MRLFVSVDLPDRMAGEIAEIQEALQPAPGLNFTVPEQAHVTLKFLGDVDPGRVDAVTGTLEDAVDEAGVDPFDATVEGLGVFPSLDYISVVWIGVEDDGEFAALHEAVEEAFVAMGFQAADHEFTPHVTVARMEHAEGKERVQRVVQENDPTVGSMRVETVALTESTILDAGPVYSTVQEVHL